MIPRPRLVISRSDALKLEGIWNAHASSILAMLGSFCSSPEDAQDALQELFLRIGKNPAVVESAKSPRAFLIVSARRIAIDLARKRTADQARLESLEAVEALHPPQAPAKNDPELEAALSAAVQKLPSEQRAVFVAKIIQGKTLAVIAAEQNISLNTAASRLRYSLDKIRSQLRPHYEAMKNQSNKPNQNSLSDSSERLIKPLEPKRVPSVVPGLEGMAAMAADDFENMCVSLPPEVFATEETPADGDVEISGCDGGNAWENLFPPPTTELPPESSENSGELEIVFEENTDDESIISEILPSEETSESSAPSESPEVVICEMLPPVVEIVEEPILIVCEPGVFPPPIGLPEATTEPIDFSEEPVEEIFEEIFEGETSTEVGSEEIPSEDWTQYASIDGELEIIEETIDGDGEPEFGIEETGGSGLTEDNAELLAEYEGFLAENPDWLTENSGGEIQAQVITPSQYTGLELSTPGTAQAFDLWFYNKYIAPYENASPVEEGSLNLAGKPYDYGTLLTNDQPDQTGIPKSWWRGVPVELTANGVIAYMSAKPDLDQEATHILVEDHQDALSNPGASTHSVAKDIDSNVNQSVAETSTVEESAVISSRSEASRSAAYQFTAEEVASSQEIDASSTTSSRESDTAISQKPSVPSQVQSPSFSGSPVVPIVSGSDEVIDSRLSDRQMIAEHTKLPFTSVELPTLVETKSASAADELHTPDDIAFTDDDSFVLAPNAEESPSESMTNAPAKTDVAAAVGGAFAVGTATQAAPARGASVKKVIPA